MGGGTAFGGQAFRTLVVLYWVLAISIYYEMINVWHIVSAIIRLHMVFLSTDYLFQKQKQKPKNQQQKRIGQVTMGTLYIRLTWWRHEMEPFSALLALCAWNSAVTDEFPSVTRSFDVFFDLRLE